MKKLLKKIFNKIDYIFKNCVSLFFYFCPIQKNKIVVQNFFGKGYGDNPKYIIKEMLASKKDVQIVWLVDKFDENMPHQIKQVKLGSTASYYHMITAKLWICNIRNAKHPIFKRKKQFYLQTWHGGVMAFKLIEKAAENMLSKSYVRDAKHDGKISDLILAGSDEDEERIKKQFWYDGPILKIPLPKTDIIVKPDNQVVQELKKKYHIENKKIVLYAPTFRSKYYFYKMVDFVPDQLVEHISKKFGGDYIFCVRLHPNDCKKGLPPVLKNAISFTDEPDSQVVLSASDIVISDFSSMCLDMYLTDKPTLIYAPDYDKYMSLERGIVRDIRKMPSPFANNNKELLENIDNFDKGEYLKVKNQLLRKVGTQVGCDGGKKVVEYLTKNNII